MNLFVNDIDSIGLGSALGSAAGDAAVKAGIDPARVAAAEAAGIDLSAANGNFGLLQYFTSDQYIDLQRRVSLQKKAAEVVEWFRMTPGANPAPDEAALEFYAKAGRAAFDRDVAAFRAANPEAARQIDLLRGRLGLPGGIAAEPDTPPPSVIVVPDKPVVLPPERIVDCAPGYKWDGKDCVPIPGYVAPPEPVFPDVVVEREPFDSWFDEKGNIICAKVKPTYSKKFPQPTATKAMKGFLWGEGPSDIPWQCPFDLKAGDPIPDNWEEDKFVTVEPVTPTTPGVAPLLLAVAAAYFLGS